DATALATLRRVTGVGWVVVQGNQAPAWPPVVGTTSLVHAGDLPAARIYRVLGGEGDLVERVRAVLAGGGAGLARLGLARTALAGRAARGRVGGAVPARLGAGLFATVFVDVTNRARVPWPGLSVWSAGTVGVQARWRERRTGGVVNEGPWLPL